MTIRPYLKLIVEPLLYLAQQEEDIENPPPFTGLDNLEFLLTRILEDETLPEDKIHRWIGFVQGVMAARGIIDVKFERNRTRAIFHDYYRSIGIEPPATIEKPLATESPAGSSVMEDWIASGKNSP